MDVHVYYAGREWILGEGVDRATVQSKIMSLGSNGGIIELALADGGTLGLVAGSSIPIAVVEGPKAGSTYTRLPR